MNLDEEHSTVIDSTLSTSFPTVVKRAAHTYGRRKADPQTLLDDFESNPEPRKSISRLSPLSVCAEVSPRSSVGDGNDDDGNEGAKDISPRFRYSWQRELWKIDHPSEDDPSVSAFIPASRGTSDGHNENSSISSAIFSRSKSRSSPTPPTSDEDQAVDIPSKTMNERKAGEKLIPLKIDSHFSEVIHVPKTNATGVNGKLKSKKSSKTKAPTSKELIETAKHHSRTAAAQYLSLPRSEGQKHTIDNFFQSLSKESVRKQVQPSSSDPIISFSSPPQVDTPITESSPKSPQVRHATPPLTSHCFAAPLPAIDSDSDGELPEVNQILKEKERATALAEVKKRALANQAARREIAGSVRSDDELEIVGNMVSVAEEEASRRRAMKARHARPSEGRTRQLLLGGIRQTTPRRTKHDSLEELKALAEPLFKASTGAKYEKRREEIGKMDQPRLNKMLAKRVEEDKTEITRKKEEEWLRRGGRLGSEQRSEEPGSNVADDARRVYIEKGLRMAEKGRVREEETQEGDEESDENWIPEAGNSESPRVNHASTTHIDTEGDVTSSYAAETDEEVPAIRPPRALLGVAARSRVIVDSDEDDDRFSNSQLHGRIPVPDTLFVEEDMPPSSQTPVMYRRRPSSSLGDCTEDDTDKENNTRLMYDRSEDKENKAVVRHSPVITLDRARSGSLLSLGEGSDRSLSVSPRVDLSFGYQPMRKETERHPLKELASHTEDPFASQTEVPTSSFVTRLQQLSPTTPEPTFVPKVFSLKESGFSQFPDDGENDENSLPIVKMSSLQAGFTQLFEFGTSKSASTPKTVTVTDEDENQPPLPLDCLRKSGGLDELSLTLDVRLQPALEVSERVRCKADLVFEKEQNYLLEAARQKPKSPELYVTDHGFLTQTRPDVSSPEIYRPAPPPQSSEPFMFRSQMFRSQPDLPLVSQDRQREPLRTLSFLEDIETPDYASRHRLRRRDLSPLAPAVDISSRSSPSSHAGHKKLDAFFISRNARSQVKTHKPRVKLGESEFVEAEAQESDDDEMRGFGVLPKKDDEEEEEGEHLDKNLEDLVDDAEMDAETQAKEKVLEKVKEHQEEDDLKLEKLHRDAVEGKLRVKRRDHGLELDDSSEEEDDEHASRIRRRMRKKRRIEGDGLEALGLNEETRPFYEAYQKDLADDDELDLEHLRQEDVVMMDEPEEEVEGVSAAEIREQARTLVREAVSSETIDPNDVSWIDQDAPKDEGDTRIIKAVSSKLRKQPVTSRPALDQIDFDCNLERPERTFETERERARLASWAKTENRSRNTGTGRMATGAAVTGHVKSKVKAGEGSVRSTQHISSDTTAGQPKPLKRRGFLSGIEDRTLRFEES